MGLLKNWKIHLLCLLITLVAEGIGIQKFGFAARGAARALGKGRLAWGMVVAGQRSGAAVVSFAVVGRVIKSLGTQKHALVGAVAGIDFTQ